VTPTDWSLTRAYHYELPREAIARVPAEPRSAARLLVALGDEVRHCRVRDLPGLLEPGDLVVVNDSRVIPARLHASRATGGQVEILLLGRRAEGFEALVRPNRRVREGERLLIAGTEGIEVGGIANPAGPTRIVRVLDDSVLSVGEIPLPPYLAGVTLDPQRYQTVFARNPGSVAAPTAGLHLDAEVLGGLARRGIEVVAVELQVGLDTFSPVREDRMVEHKIHGERYRVTEEVAAKVASARRVVAIGTTVVRTLETVATSGALEGMSELFITPGYRFRAVDVLLTNFHVPSSTLVALVAAAIGERWRELYQLALAEGYRFLSLGDAMLIPTGRRAQ
jgi:S-adenosylmethionine:tRNA ribosyltransferase-isomerase